MKPYRLNLKSGGSFLKKVRQLENLSQPEVAKKLKISRSHWVNLECGKRPIGTWPTFTRICNVLGISPTVLICWYYPPRN